MITADAPPDAIDEQDTTGLTEDGWNLLHDALTALGYDDIAITELSE